MDFTGERYVPTVGGEIRQEHLHRYALASTLVAGLRVLDIACGEGYGSAMLAAQAGHVVGVDISEETVAHATAAYASPGRIEFRVGSAAQLPLETGSVDAIVSFETIEHHDQHEAMFAEFVRVLRPGGLLVLSSPNKAIYSDEAGYHNEFHVKELYFDELDQLARRHFSQVAYLGQRFATGSTILPLAPDGTPASRIGEGAGLWTDDGTAVVQRSPGLAAPVYYLLLATRGKKLPAVPSSVLLSEAADLYLEFKKVARWASGVHGELQAAQAQAKWRESALTSDLEQWRARAEALETAARDAKGREQLHGEQLQALHAALGSREASLQESEQREQGLQARAAALQEELERARAELALAAEAGRAQQAANLTLQAANSALQQQLVEALQRSAEQERSLHEQLATLAARRAADRADAAMAQQVAEQQRALLQARLQQQARSAEDALHAAQAQSQQRLDAARQQLDAAVRDAAQRQADDETAWRSRLAQALREARREQRLLRADHARELDAAKAQSNEALRLLADTLERREAAFEAERQALERTLAETRAQLLALSQQALADDRQWQRRLEQAGETAALASRAAGAALAQQRRALLLRSELAALLARGLLEQGRAWPVRLLGPWRGWLSGSDAAGSPAGPTAWRQAAMEALLLRVNDTTPQEAGPRADFTTIEMMTTNPEWRAPGVRSVADLLALDDASFVQAAYTALLGRQPDPVGRKHYMDALLAGEPRLQVLHDLRNSEEGRAREPQLAGFEAAMRTLRRSRLPVIGRLFRPALPAPVGLATRRIVETLAADLEASQARVDERLAGIERLLKVVRSQAEQQALAALIMTALSRYTWPPETDLWRASMQFAEAAQDRFIQDAFAFLLNRVPHGYELMHYREQLSRGGSRLLVVERIVQSDEFMSAHPPLLVAPRAAGEAGGTPLLEALPSVPIHARPTVSVVIPIYGKLEYTLRCLRSIATHPPRVPFEVIVVDDCSPDDSAEVLARVPGIRLERNEKNLGFIRSCNRGASLARGSHVCFLNNDTEVHAAWLDELLATFDLFPGTGLVGSKLIYPDGKLQEAGGIIWRNGNAWNFGRGQDPDLPVYNYAREVDYCSGASILLPKALFDELGGFDEHYLPAYCEDSDLALKVRAKGLRVIYQPMSVVVHHEGISSGTDTASGTKAYQVANSRKLFERWKDHLAAHQPDAENVDDAKDRMHKLRVLVLEHCNPTPDQDAGSVSVFNMLLLLREMGFQVTFIPEDNFLYEPPYTQMMQRAGIEVIYGPHVTSVKQHVQEHGGRYDLCFLFRPVVVERHAATLRTFCPQAKLLFYTHDIHHIRMEREAALLKDDVKVAEAAAMKAREFAAIRAVDSTIVVSTAEMEILKPQLPDQPLQMLPLLLDVPGTTVGFESRQGVLFVGGFQHTPNVDAVEFFVAEVMPLLRQQLPGVVFNVVGSKPPPAIKALAGPDVIIHGFVEDLKPILDEMRVSVAPLRYGAGVKGKVGTALANGLPTVCTPMAAEGMGVVDGEQVLIGATPAGLAEAVARLHLDGRLWARISGNGLDFARDTWGPQASYGSLASIIRSIGIPVDDNPDALVLYTPEIFATTPATSANAVTAPT